ncbi:MAG: DUF58 domain-containing protein [Planctomycetaceae bacterium]|jgi:uncharacterized protein (DUF58 family)|nr:DUF58 domain-containing protein [Planctomycetaceae bacterium]
MDYENLMLGYRFGSQVTFSEPPQTPLGMVGNLLGRSIGSSLEFMEHRDYNAGDDLRRIDWNSYARSDRLAVKLFREEVNPHVDLLLDVSKSMSLNKTKKAAATFALAGFFASAAAESKFSFRIYVTDNGCRVLGRSHLPPLEWDSFELETCVSPADAIQQMPPNWRPHGIRVVVSDLLFPAEPVSFVSQIAGDSAVTIFVQLLAESDTEPPEHGNLRLIDSETAEQLELYIDSISRERYKRNLARHLENYNIAIRRYGAFMTTVIAEQFIQNGRIDDLMQMELIKYSRNV